MPKTALITGITGQDGSYLAELLLAKGYEVHGIIRRASTFNTERIDHIYQDPHDAGPRLLLHYGDLADGVALVNLLRDDRSPTRSTTSARRATSGCPSTMPEYTGDVTGLGTIRLLEAIRAVRGATRGSTRRRSSEMFGATPPPQNEETPFHPRSPYGCAKVYAYWVDGELPRGVRHVRGQRHPVQPREPAPRRDVRHPQDHPRGRPHQGRHAGRSSTSATSTPSATGATPRSTSRRMWRMLQQDEPDDYVVATGEAATVREFCEAAFAHGGPGLGEVRALRRAVRAARPRSTR